MAAVTICSDFGAQKIKSDTVSTISPSICYEVMGLDAVIFVFWILSFKPTFSLSSFTFIKRLFSSSSLSAISVVSSEVCHIWGICKQFLLNCVLYTVPSSLLSSHQSPFFSYFLYPILVSPIYFPWPRLCHYKLLFIFSKTLLAFHYFKF